MNLVRFCLGRLGRQGSSKNFCSFAKISYFWGCIFHTQQTGQKVRKRVFNWQRFICTEFTSYKIHILVYLEYITLRVGCCLRENATIIFIKTTWWRLRTLNNELWISLLWNLMRHSWASFPRHLLAKKAKPFHTSVSNSNYPNLFLSLPTLTYYGCCCLHTKHRLRTSGMTFFHEKIGIIYRLKQIRMPFHYLKLVVWIFARFLQLSRLTRHQFRN